MTTPKKKKTDENDTSISLYPTYRIRRDKLSTMTDTCRQLTAGVRANEPGNLLYVYSVAEDTTTTTTTTNNEAGGATLLLLQCRETYKDVDAVKFHLQNSGPLFATFMENVESFVGCEIHGPTDALEELKSSPLHAMNPTYFETMRL